MRANKKYGFYKNSFTVLIALRGKKYCYDNSTGALLVHYQLMYF